jgi:hypothetical protein
VHAIHVGPGRLGLGLIVVHLEKMRLPVYLVGRVQAAEEPQEGASFLYAEIGGGLPQRQVEVFDAGNPAVLTELPVEVRSWIAGSEPLLITCALGSDAPSREALLAEILAERSEHADAETLLVACENVPDTTYARLRKRFPGVHVADAVVDRICALPEGDLKRAPDGRRWVEAHEVWEWVIALPEGTAPRLSAALSASGVQLVDGLDAYKARKLWTVNGLHQILALLALVVGVERLADAAQTPRFQAAAADIVAALTATLELRWPEVAVPEDYMGERIRAFAEMRNDTASRILRAHFVRDDLSTLIARLDERVFDAARAALEEGVDAEPFLLALELLITATADGKFYANRDGRTRLPDAAQADLLRRSLRDLMPPDIANVRVHEFEMWLKSSP